MLLLSSSSSLLLLLLNSIRCTTLSVVLLIPFRFPVPFAVVVVVEFDPLYYSFRFGFLSVVLFSVSCLLFYSFRFRFPSCSCSLSCYSYQYCYLYFELWNYSHRPCLLWLIFTTKPIIAIT